MCLKFDPKLVYHNDSSLTTKALHIATGNSISDKREATQLRFYTLYLNVLFSGYGFL